MIRYELPRHWVRYDGQAITQALTEAKAAVLALKSMPYQREWVEELQRIELKREIAGTSRIEGAEFTEKELDAALENDTATLRTRSQRQVRAAKKAYEWLATVPDGRPIDADLIANIHRLIVTDADDDHCPPGKLRGSDQNVTFGTPPHRGVDGGATCDEAFRKYAEAIQREFRGHDPIIQAHAAHYHLAAMHPFLDGNGRTARAMEVLLLGRAGLKDVAFIAVSNYYYEEKPGYLAALAETRKRDHDLTPFLLFTLKGVAVQCERLLDPIRTELKKGVFRNTMYDLFGRLESPRKRVIAKRQIEVLKLLLRFDGWVAGDEFLLPLFQIYGDPLKHPLKAASRDLGWLETIGAIEWDEKAESAPRVRVNLDWPTTITQSEFTKRLAALPKAKTHRFLQP